MINPLSSIDEINKILRNQLIKQSELDGKKVLNGVSIHGQDLITQVNKFAYKSYSPMDSVIVFDLTINPTENDISQTLEDGSIQIYSSYSMKCYTYGFSSKELVLKIVARLRSEEARQELYENGVHLTSVEDIVDGKEFVNDTMYIRTDFTINISVMSIITKVEENPDLINANFTIKEIR